MRNLISNESVYRERVKNNHALFNKSNNSKPVDWTHWSERQVTLQGGEPVREPCALIGASDKVPGEIRPSVDVCDNARWLEFLAGL